MPEVIDTPSSMVPGARSSNPSLTPFRVEVPQGRLDWIANRVAAYPWPEPGAPGWTEGWEYGVSLSELKALCGHWLDRYDWRAWEAKLNAAPQYMAKVPGGDLHCYIEEGSGPAPAPLLLLHGWPGSVFEFLHLIEPLAHPERFGGSVEDAFTVIVPSLPGYGFSACPERPIGPREVARRMDVFMREVLGFDGYLVQGGDWGALIGAWMGYEAPGCRGLHLNLMGWDAPGQTFDSEEEQAYAVHRAATADDGLGYAHEQRTRPQTLSVAMRDSPVGVCAWILEKFHGWSDIREGFDHVYSADQLLTNIMLYLASDSFNSAAWLYKGRDVERFGDAAPPGARIEVPTAVANFPKEFIPWPPRSFVERSVNVVRWTDFEAGGHFPALERPDDLMGDIRAFARRLRGQAG
jgi:pimeloyl-ACP methyl ester carboxylesterase